MAIRKFLKKGLKKAAKKGLKIAVKKGFKKKVGKIAGLKNKIFKKKAVKKVGKIAGLKNKIGKAGGAVKDTLKGAGKFVYNKPGQSTIVGLGAIGLNKIGRGIESKLKKRNKRKKLTSRRKR